jgi:hypothetical protein
MRSKKDRQRQQTNTFLFLSEPEYAWSSAHERLLQTAMYRLQGEAVKKITSRIDLSGRSHNHE